MLTKLLVIFGFCLALAAGVALGLRLQMPAVHPAAPATGPSSRPSHRGAGWLSAELGLSAAQEEQLQKIWSETARRSGREQDELRRKCRRERDEAIAALIPPADQPQYQAVLEAYSHRMSELETEARAGFDRAVEATKRILTDPQLEKYEQLLKRREVERGGRDRRPSSRDSGGWTPPPPPARDP